MRATTNNTPGVNGGAAVFGHHTPNTGASSGVHGSSDSNNGTGVTGIAWASSGTTFGVYGRANSPTGYGVYSVGDCYIAGNLSKFSGSFKIDHPLDPENKYLVHSFVESPDMKNIYDGVVVLDGSGEATVNLPHYFETLNRDFRYLLTPIGEAMPNLHIAQEVIEGTFRIAGGTPFMKVSWQVTGVRQDPWAEENRIQVEPEKRIEDRGKYLAPELYGKPANFGIHYREISHPEEVMSVSPSSNGDHR